MTERPDYIKVRASKLVARDRVVLSSKTATATEYRLTDIYRVRGNVNAETENGELFSWRPAALVVVHRQTHMLLTAESVTTLDTSRF